MRSKYLFKKGHGSLKKIAITAIIVFSFGILSAQPAKTLTAKDKEVIIEIFNTIHSSLYKFQFSKEESFGTKNVSPMSASLLRNGKIVNFSNSISATYFPVMNFWFAVGKTKPPGDELEGIFGKANAARLQAIIKKYTGGN